MLCWSVEKKANRIFTPFGTKRREPFSSLKRGTEENLLRFGGLTQLYMFCVRRSAITMTTLAGPKRGDFDNNTLRNGALRRICMRVQMCSGPCCTPKTERAVSRGPFISSIARVIGGVWKRNTEKEPIGAEKKRQAIFLSSRRCLRVYKLMRSCCLSFLF